MNDFDPDDALGLILTIPTMRLEMQVIDQLVCQRFTWQVPGDSAKLQQILALQDLSNPAMMKMMYARAYRAIVLYNSGEPSIMVTDN